ncbi:MAG: hypothetical protein JXQ75_20445 [Phycisphaerae bacterium]|nr:hypothetical protein [Phycisphaerae bacterium]
MPTATTAQNALRRNRDRLLRRFEPSIRMNPRLDRSLVSFQANRKTPFFSWFKYKEAFSAELVRYVVDEFCPSGGVLLDPFAGVGTALVVARSMGVDSIGIEVLPVGFLAVDARVSAEAVPLGTFKRHVRVATSTDWADYFDRDYALRHIPITRGAFPGETDRAIAGYRAYCNRRIRDPHVRRLFDLSCLAVLESVSYTRKDGQYLRWDYRARKPRLQSRFDKGVIPSFNSAIRNKLRQIYAEVSEEANSSDYLLGLPKAQTNKVGSVDTRRGSCLDILPGMPDASVSLVLTSPPYCNRYDYTRTYALELVYLGLDAEQIKSLRQSMLSCTVENRAKTEQMRTVYHRIGRNGVFDRVCRVFDQQSALHEVLGILDGEAQHGRLNNANIPRMVRNYFFEMCFVIYELVRVLQPGGCIVMVNDNVRYIGEEVPVDLILSDFATAFGLQTERIWTLSRGKGNSSQQMGAHGRNELRKCVYVWRRA